MNDLILTGLAFLAGIALGFLFFGGLWWTVKVATNSKNPALWFLGSLVFRLAVVLAGFYSIGAGDLIRLLSCFVGFITARFLVLSLTKGYDLKQQKGKTTHEA